jgi:hypothetical protein
VWVAGGLHEGAKASRRDVPLTSPPSRQSDRMSNLEGNLAKANGLEASRGPGVLTIELVYELRGTDVSFVNPGVFFASITFPSDQELE